MDHGQRTKNKKGCLVIHGLTGTPANLESVITALKAKGYIVKTPLLKGHGSDLKTLMRTTWPEWYESVLKSYEELSKETEAIYFVGLSMGALLGLKLAIDGGDGPLMGTVPLKALALLAVPFQVRPIFRYVVIPGVRYTPLRFFIRSVAKNFEKSVLNPEGRELYRANSLARMPSQCVFQTQNLVKLIKKDLTKIAQPLLLIHGAKDHLADPRGLLDIQKQVTSPIVDVVMLENSAHVITVDYEREQVANRVVGFFEKF